MKILFLSPLLPWPLYSGGQIRVFHLLKILSQKHQVNLIAFTRNDKETKYLNDVRKVCDNVEIILRKNKPWTLSTLIKTLFSTKPLLMNLYHNDIDLTDLINWTDLIWCECFYLNDMINTIYKSNKFTKKFILGEENIEYLAYERYFDSLIWWKRIVLFLPVKLDLLKMKFWEKRIWRQTKKIAVASIKDKTVIEKEIGRNNIAVIANGVNIENYNFKKINIDSTILFVGNFKWFQNQQAVEWLVKEIFPKIKKEIPEVKLMIVGKNQPNWIKDFRKIGIFGEENLEDIREAYIMASVFLAPLKSGSGTKYKLLEAMASGVPVVTTSMGFEGFEGFEEAMIVKEKTEDLVKATIDILQNSQKYEEMRQRARQMIEKDFDWKIIAGKLEKFVDEN